MAEPPRPVVVTDPVTISVDGNEVVVQKGELLINACERSGTYIPRFCYHPRMEPVGMCRMCLVEVDTGRGPALQPSCMIECADGMSVDTESDRVVKAQDGVLEYLLINHPLDCPVCDKGGECPLQDQTMAYGPGESRFVEEKRHYPKPIAISETVLLDRERCILCDRCTRFAKDVAGDALIHFMDRGANTQVNTFPDEPFASYFSGNTVQICPVGALTAKPYRFKARPWDLTEVESTCTNCSVGCRISIESSRDQVLRYQGVDIDPVNWGWLCDKGRFGFEAVQSVDRLTAPLVREGESLREASWNEALDRASAVLSQTDPAAIAVIGGARLTNEAAYAWAKLAKAVIGTDNCDAQLDDGLPADVVAGLPPASIDDVCRPGGTVLYLGPDPKEQLPVLFLRLRHAICSDRVTVVEVAPTGSSLTPLAAASVRYRPGEVADVVAGLLGNDRLDDASMESARSAIAAAVGPLTVVLGRPSVTERPGPLVDAAGAILAARPDATFLPALRRGNVRGALDAGLAPGMFPGRVRREDGLSWFDRTWGRTPDAEGLDTRAILEATADGRIEVLVLLGADPVADVADTNLADRALARARAVIAVDQFVTVSGRRCDVVLAAAGFAEVEGTTTNLEGRVSRLGRKVTAPGTARSDLVIAAEIARRLGGDLGFTDEDGALAELISVSPLHRGLERDAAGLTRDGIVLPVSADERLVSGSADDSDEAGAGGADEPGPDDSTTGSAEADDATGSAEADDATGSAEADGTTDEPDEPAPPTMPEVARFEPPTPTPLPGNDSYSLRLVATRRLYDHGTLLAHSPSSAVLASSPGARLNPAEASKLGIADGDRIRLIGNDASVVVSAHADPDVPRGSVEVVWGAPDAEVGRLVDSSALAVDVRIEVAR